MKYESVKDIPDELLISLCRRNLNKCWLDDFTTTMLVNELALRMQIRNEELHNCKKDQY